MYAHPSPELLDLDGPASASCIAGTGGHSPTSLFEQTTSDFRASFALRHWICPISDQSLAISNAKQSSHSLLSKELNKTEAPSVHLQNAECRTVMACTNWARPLQQGALAGGEVMVGAPATFLCLFFYINTSSSSWVECDLYAKPNCEAQRKERCKSENWKCDSAQWFFQLLSGLYLPNTWFPSDSQSKSVPFHQHGDST